MKKLSVKTLSTIVYVCSVIVLFLSVYQLISLHQKKRVRNEVENYKVDYTAQAVLKYDACKSALVDNVDSFIQREAPSSNLTGFKVVEECQKYNVSIVFILAQGDLESKFGTIGLGEKTNSVWNQGAFDSYGYDEILDVHKFSHPDLSIEPYLKMLTKNYLSSNKIETDLMRNFVNRQGKRYASSTSYEKNLQMMYEYVDSTTCIDSLEKALHYWAIRANIQ